MTDHRNVALGAFGLVAVIAAWRLIRRASAPSALFVAAIFAASALVATTAYKGGRLVYHYGLGVASMPMADEGEGHHHNGAATEHHHDDDADEADNAGDRAHHPAAAVAVHPADAGSPAAAVDAFAAALHAGDEAVVKSLLADDVIIAEEGGAERSGEEYASHHLGADMAFMRGVETTQIKRDEILSDNLAAIVTESMVHGSFMTKPVHSRVMETMVLKRDNGVWRIHHIHWSSAPIEGEHEH
jgi:ketosteroid isomerase-like protein